MCGLNVKNNESLEGTQKGDNNKLVSENHLKKEASQVLHK